MADSKFSNLKDADLRKLFINSNEGADQIRIQREIVNRAAKYQKQTDAICGRYPIDFDSAIEALQKAHALTVDLTESATVYNDQIAELDSIRKLEKGLIQRTDAKLLIDSVEQATELDDDGKLPKGLIDIYAAARFVVLEERLKQRVDMRELKSAVEEATVLKKELPGILKDVLEAARTAEGEHRQRTGDLVTKGRTGAMTESRQSYVALKNNTSAQVWDPTIGSYVEPGSDSFKTLVETAYTRWKAATENSIQDFRINPESSYSKLDDLPVLTEEALYRNFSPSGVDLVHPDCASQYKTLKDEVEAKANAYCAAEKLYKESTTIADKVEAYGKVIEAFTIYAIYPEPKVKKTIIKARKDAKEFTFGNLSDSLDQSEYLIDRFDFSGFVELLKNIWKTSEELEKLLTTDSTLKGDSQEMKDYIKRKGGFQQQLEALNIRCGGVKNNYDRIEAVLGEFEETMTPPDAHETIDAPETWGRLEKFLVDESAFLGANAEMKNFSDYFQPRIDKIKSQLRPLLGDQQQLELIRESEFTPEKWPDILTTSSKFRKKYSEAGEIYERVFKNYNLALLEESITASDFVTARKCLNDLYKQKLHPVEELESEEKRVREAEQATTSEVERFYVKACSLAESLETSKMLEAWVMFRNLTPELYGEGQQHPARPALTETCKYAGQSRGKAEEIYARLKNEAKRVSENARAWNLAVKSDQDLSKERNVLAGTAKDIGLLRAHDFLSTEQLLDCKPLEIWDARLRAEQHAAQQGFEIARGILQEMKNAYGNEIESDLIRLRQIELLHVLTEKLKVRDFQGAIDEINRVELENMAVVSQCYEIRLKHALALEGLKLYDRALEKLNDIRPDLLSLALEDLQLIESERNRLKIEGEVHKGIANFEQAVKREETRYKNAPGYFISSLVHLSALKELSEKYANHHAVKTYFQEKVKSVADDLIRLIDRNRNIPRESVERDVFLYRLCLRELKRRFAFKLNDIGESWIDFGEDKKGKINDQNQLPLTSACDYIKDQFDKVNPDCQNSAFLLEEAELQSGSLGARDMADLMSGYHEQFNLLLTVENILSPQKSKELKGRAGIALYMTDRLRELCERSDVETSWVYTLRNGYASALWKSYFNGKLKNPDGDTIPKIKTRLTYIKKKYLNEKIIELDEFNKKLGDADLLKLEIENKIDHIANGYNNYLTLEKYADWTVSNQVLAILRFETAVSEEIKNKLAHSKEEIQEAYPKIIAYYDDVIEFPAKEPLWAWKGFSECKEKALTIETHIKVWQDWSKEIGFVELVKENNQNEVGAPGVVQNWIKMQGRIQEYASAHDFAAWAGHATVPWDNNNPQRMRQAAAVLKEKNWYTRVFEGIDKNNHIWEVDPPEGEHFQFKRFLLEVPLPQTYQLWLWQVVLSKNDALKKMVDQGPVEKGDTKKRIVSQEAAQISESRLDDYPALVPAAENLKTLYQDVVVELADQKKKIENIIAPLEKARKAFPSLDSLDNYFKNKQFDQLGRLVKEAKMIGPKNRSESGYLSSKEADLVKLESLKQNKGCLFSLFGKK